MILSRMVRFTVLPAVACLMSLTAVPGISYAQSLTGVTIGTYASCTVDSAGQVDCLVSGSISELRPPTDLPAMAFIDSGNAHTCGLDFAGAITCWGRNGFGQLNSPTAGAPFQQLSVGKHSSCAVDANEQARCWGLTDNGISDPPNGTDGFTRVAVGKSHACGIRPSGSIDCWGASNNGQLAVEEPGPFIDVSVGESTSCALRTDGSITCWPQAAPRFANIPADGPYVALKVSGNILPPDFELAANNMICGMTADGRIDCTSTDFDGVETNYGPASGRYIAFDSDPVRSYGCAIRDDGTATCWGFDPQEMDSVGAEATLPPAPDNVRVERYGAELAEVFWTPPQRFSLFDISGYDVLRDGEPYAFTTNQDSYLDDSLISGTAHRYSVVTIDINGLRSAESPGVTLEVVSDNPDTDYRRPERPGTPGALQAFIYGETRLELVWERPSVGVRGYEIYRDGDYLRFTDGLSYIDDDILGANSYRYEVVSIGSDNAIAGYAILDVDRLPGGQCN